MQSQRARPAPEETRMAVNTQSSPTLGRRGRAGDALTEWLAGRAALAYPRIAIQLAQDARSSWARVANLAPTETE